VRNLGRDVVSDVGLGDTVPEEKERKE